MGPPTKHLVVLQCSNHNQNLECIDVIFVVQCHSLYVIYMNSEFLACMLNIINKQKKKKKKKRKENEKKEKKKKKRQKTCMSPEPGAKANWQWGQVGWMLADHRDGLLSSSF